MNSYRILGEYKNIIADKAELAILNDQRATEPYLTKGGIGTRLKRPGFPLIEQDARSNGLPLGQVLSENL